MQIKKETIEKANKMGMKQETKLIEQAKRRGHSTNTQSGLTPKQNHFAQLVANKHTLNDAYRQAYNAENMLDSSISVAASQLMRNAKIIDKINTYVAAIDNANRHDPEAIRRIVLNNLLDMANSGTIPASVKLKANELLGKVTGVRLFQDQPTQDQATAAQTAIKLLEHRLNDLLGKPQTLTVTEVADMGSESVEPPDQGEAQAESQDRPTETSPTPESPL